MANISKNLIRWYSKHKRDLPWRETNHPYYIWISEIILQQTRVNQGIGYYYRFIEKFPDIASLANAHIDEVLKVWQGLGYYTRARNIHFTANYIIKELNGVFPSNFHDLKKLKGIGDYTAAAIASFAFNEPVPAIDGNVYRFLSRLFGIYEPIQLAKSKKIFFEKASKIIDKSNPAEFNQAIMEFGSLQCTPGTPDCTICIFKSTCYAYNNQCILDLPVKKQTIKTRTRYFHYLHIIHKNHVFIQKRTQNDIWKLLYELPLIETSHDTCFEELIKTLEWKQIFNEQKTTVSSHIIEKKHTLSHQIIQAKFYKLTINKTTNWINSKFIKIPINELDKYSTPRLVQEYLENFYQ